MTSIRRTSLSADATEVTVHHLQETLYDLIDLGLQAKQAHWNVIGRRFRSVHTQLDEIVDSLRPFSDAVAERIVILGEPANGLAGQIAQGSKLDAMPTGFIEDDDVVTQVVDRLSGVCGRIRDRVKTLEDSDPVSADLLISQLAKLEEQMWMFHAQAQ